MSKCDVTRRVAELLFSDYCRYLIEFESLNDIFKLYRLACVRMCVCVAAGCLCVCIYGGNI